MGGGCNEISLRKRRLLGKLFPVVVGAYLDERVDRGLGTKG